MTTINESIPEQKANIRLLLVSGKKSDILVSPTDTIDTVTKLIV